MSAILEYGDICNVYPSEGLVRVSFPQYVNTDDGGPLVSDKIPYITSGTKADKESFPFEIGQPVACVMENEDCENGVVLGCIFNQTDMPDGAGTDIFRHIFKDGSAKEFDRSTGDYRAHYKGSYQLTADGNIELNGATKGGVPISANVANKLNVIENDLNTVKQALQALLAGPPIPEPGSGAPSALQAALAAALASWYGSALVNTDPTNIENTAVKQ